MKPFSGASEKVRQTRRPPDQCFDWDSIADLLLAGEKPVCRPYRSMPAWTSRSGRKRELAETWERADFERGGHTFLAGVAWITIRLNTKQNSNRLACVTPSCHSQGGLKPPMELPSPCVQMWSESESCYHARTKAKISSDVWAPNSLRSHLTASKIQKISWGSIPPDPPSFCIHALTYAHGYNYR